MKNRAVHVVSIGKTRHWFKQLVPYTSKYAEACDAELSLLISDEMPKSLIDELEALGCQSQLARLRLAKLVSVAELLESFDQVLLLDDSCCVVPGAANVFECHIAGTIGAVRDGGVLGREDPGAFNTGVVLFDGESADFLHDLATTYRRFSTREFMDDQILMNLAHKDGLFEVNYLDERFNVVGTQLSESRIMDSADYIYHLTSGVRDRMRQRYAEVFTQRHPIPRSP